MIKKILLPNIPKDIILEIYNSIDLGTNKAFQGKDAIYKIDQYNWYSANEKVQQWGQDNISPDIHLGVQVIDDDLPMHKDHGTKIKFNYLITSGGPDATTNFYNDEKVLLQSVKLELETWYILDVTTNHEVVNIEPNQQRISITGRILP